MLEYWLWLSGRRGLGVRGLRALLEQFGTPEAVYCASDAEYPSDIRPDGRTSLADKKLAPARQILQQCYRQCIHIVTLQDAVYPQRLKNIDDAPLVLYYQGVLPDFDAEPVIAMVGTRRASAYGLLQAKRLGYELGRYGAIVVSGGAARLHLSDEKRILRALEVYRQTGETITEHDARTRGLPPRYEAYYIGLSFRERADLYARIDRRVDAMVDRGLLQEVEQLLQSGLPEDATALQAIGYKQFLAVRRGEATAQEAVEEVKLRSRQYAKRQLTWLRRNEAIHWILWEKEPNFPMGLQNATEYLTAQGLG